MSFDFNHRRKLEDVLESYKIKKEDICLIGSMPLALHDIRDNEDVDFLTTEKNRERVQKLANERSDCYVRDNGAVHFKHNSGEYIEMSSPNHYEVLGIEDRDLIFDSDYHIVADGYKIIRLEIILSMKYTQRRAKDMRDVELIEASQRMERDDWNWDLVKPLPPWELSGPSKTIYERFLSSLERNGLIYTLKRGIEKSENKIFLASILKNQYKKYLKYQRGSDLSNLYEQGAEIYMPIPQILSNHFNENSFDAWDIVIHFYNIKNDTNIGEISNTESDDVYLFSNGQLCSGSRSIAENIVQNEYSVPVYPSYESGPPTGTKNWLKSIVKNRNDLIDIKRERERIFQNTGVYFYGIVWPTAISEFQNMLNFIEEDERVQLQNNIIIDVDDLESFVWDVYEADSQVRDWTLKKKIQSIETDHSEIGLVILYVPSPNFIFKNNDRYSQTTDSLKNDIRKDFKANIDEYIYDNIIHISDNYEQNWHLSNIIEDL